eukprot:TRINITY_DN69903_c0_g1_i1.p2 TRINITY_DN69903_c0_g1~~TRINITY_DN69903_c0_g1_i1.p2  ORF type:complete len:110 (-),score=36.73 TRINITY_DN69903_c0_g1_i1:164-493(-)
MGGSASSLLKKIDASDADPGKTDRMIEKLFKKFDKDDSGSLRGDEFSQLLDEVTDYVYKEIEAAEAGQQYDREVVRDYVKNFMDCNRDGSCTLAEMRARLPALLNADGD